MLTANDRFLERVCTGLIEWIWLRLTHSFSVLLLLLQEVQLTINLINQTLQCGISDERTICIKHNSSSLTNNKIASCHVPCMYTKLPVSICPPAGDGTHVDCRTALGAYSAQYNVTVLLRTYTQRIRSRLVEAPSFTNVREGLKIHKIVHEYSCLLTDKQMPLKHNLLDGCNGNYTAQEAELSQRALATLHRLVKICTR